MAGNAIILGDRSDIAKGLRAMLEADGWKVIGWHRGNSVPALRWDLLLIAMGSVAPVGHWWNVDEIKLVSCLDSNLIMPLTYLTRLWGIRNPGASICWLAGSNPNSIMDGYAAYNISKMAVLKAVEQLDHESPDAKFFALGPGTVVTKIHKPTIESGWHNPKLKAVIDSGKGGTPIAKIYQCMMWCVSMPKEVIGGRNVCVSDDWGDWLEKELERDEHMYKLRRAE